MDIPKIREDFLNHNDIEIKKQQEIFSQTYDVKVLTNSEREKVLNPFIVDAKLALKWLVESSHICTEKAEEVLNIWNNAIIVDNNGAKRLGDYHAEPYLDMYKKIKDCTPDNFTEKVTQENIEDLKKAAVATVELIHHEYENSGAIIFQPYIDPSIQTKQGLSDKIIIINKDYLDKYSGQVAHYIRALSHEETLHLANNLDKYGKPFNEIWVNEMMTKIIAISLATINNVDDDILNNQMTLVRFDDFARLYNLATEQDEGNGRLLLQIYFGKANRDHPLFERLSELLYKYNALGILLNITNIDNIKKGVEKMIQI
jgi:hypothetical protein